MTASQTAFRAAEAAYQAGFDPAIIVAAATAFQAWLEAQEVQ